MKKIININLASRVIPIEDTAYDTLKQYLESLRRYFANEEGRDEIIGDIEGRIAEIFSDKVKKGASCITDEDVTSVIASMGRPEDFQEAETIGAESGSHSNTSSSSSSTTTQAGPRRFYRDSEDKILGGVCSGLAAYINIDPAVMRILFVLFAFTGVGIFLYIILWIAVPSSSVVNHVRKRLYRNPDETMIAGVCSGLASYFNISVAWVRVIFLLPLILGIVSNTIGHWGFPFVFIGSGGFGSFCLAYVILWIVVPPANSASEKLEMRGEKVDIQNIKNTIKSDLEGFKGRAEKWGKEVNDTMKSTAGTVAAEAGPAVKRSTSGLGRAIGIVFKAFFYFIAGMIAIGLFCGLVVGVVFSINYPVKAFVVSGFWGNVAAWGTVLLFFAVPVIWIVTWIIRGIMGVKSKNKYLGFTFGSLWAIGWVCLFLLIATVGRNFKARSAADNKEDVVLTQPSLNKLFITAEKNISTNYDYDEDEWVMIDWHGENPFYGRGRDSLMLRTVRVDIVKSKDSLFHVYKVRLSRGNTIEQAKKTAQRIEFNIQQKDSSLVLPQGFGISKEDKFRNQQVLVVIEVPVGKRIEVDRSIQGYDWFSINFNNSRRRWDMDWDDNWDHSYYWENNTELIMTPNGLEKVSDLDQAELKKGNFKTKTKEGETHIDGEMVPNSTPLDNGNKEDNYRYNQNKKDSTKQNLKIDVNGEKVEIKTGSIDVPTDGRNAEVSADPLHYILKMFQL